jgi:hypothetical protein
MNICRIGKRQPHNIASEPDGIKILVVMQKLSAAANQERSIPTYDSY